MNVVERIEKAVANYGGLSKIVIHESAVEDAPGEIVSNPLGYALGWVVASAIVANRYASSAVDVIPIYHPDTGWDRFLITRRVSCTHFAEESADAFGTIMLTGEDAPILEARGHEALPLGSLLRENPQQGIEQAVSRIAEVGLAAGNHESCPHTRAPEYPTIYDVVSEIVIENPGLTVLREIFIDHERLEGDFHPLYMMTGAHSLGFEYGWFAIESPQFTVFFRLNGSQTVFQTDGGGWATVRRQLNQEDRDGMKRRILAWLRIEGAPDRKTVD